MIIFCVMGFVKCSYCGLLKGKKNKIIKVIVSVRLDVGVMCDKL